MYRDMSVVASINGTRPFYNSKVKQLSWDPTTAQSSTSTGTHRDGRAKEYSPSHRKQSISVLHHSLPRGQNLHSLPHNASDKSTLPRHTPAISSTTLSQPIPTRPRPLNRNTQSITCHRHASANNHSQRNCKTHRPSRMLQRPACPRRHRLRWRTVCAAPRKLGVRIEEKDWKIISGKGEEDDMGDEECMLAE